MARLRQPGEPLAPQDFPDGAPGFPEMPEVNPNSQPQDLPKAQEAAPAPFDRQAFQNDWMSTSGTWDDFIGSHPQYKGQVTARNGSKDVFNIPGGEVLDLVGDQGGKNAHNWTGTGFNQQGIPDAPAGRPPPSLFGSVNAYMGGQQGGPGSNLGTSDLMSTLKGLFPGGLFNQDTVSRRTENAREDLARQSKSRNATNRAALASRGLIGDGPEQTAQNRAESDIADQYSNAVSGIYADESDNADQRMMQALQLAAGLSSEEAKLIVDQFRAQTERSGMEGSLALGNRNAGIDEMLGLGNLALGNTRASNDYNLGKGQLDLGWNNADIEEWLATQGLKLQGANISSRGNVK